MVTLFVLVFVSVVLLLFKRDWRTALRWAFAAMLLVTASAHFTAARHELAAMVPPFFPRPDLLVLATGIMEIAGAIGLVIPRTSRVAAVALIVMLVAMFPANVYAAREGMTLMGKPVTPLAERTAMQLVFLAALAAPLVQRAPRPRRSEEVAEAANSSSSRLVA